MHRTIGGILIFVIFLTGNVLAASGINTRYLAHEPAEERFIYLTRTGEVNLKFQVQRSGVDEVILVLNDTGKEFNLHQIKMNYYTLNNFYCFYVTQFEPVGDVLSYYFQVKAGEDLIYYGASGPVENAADIQFFRVSVDSVQTFVTPDWAKGAVIYQIFPDRFSNGDSTNDPRSGEWDVYGNLSVVRSWTELPVNPPTGSDFFGGDLQGIIDKLDYLANLGIQAIYLNPLHESVSNHKYDASDFQQIDDNFGTIELFKKLVEEAKRRGIYIIIDGVFNHTGSNFWAFQDIVKNGKNSAYKDWYNIYSYPVNPVEGNYDSWNGYSSLPVLNYDSREVRDYILQVVRFWLNLGVKGIRLDAPTEVPHDFWQELRQVVKGIDPEVLLIGEIWQDASPWVNGKEFDSNMNYLYRTSLYNFFIKRSRSVSGFAKDLGIDLTRYPEPALHVMYNHFGSHDVERVKTLARGNTELLKPLIIFQLTYMGAPAIYYGDEIGMEGGDDPDCRRPMIWDPLRQDLELRETYESLIRIRGSSLALRQGSFTPVFIDDENKILGFERVYGSQRVFVVINNNEQSYTMDIPFDEWKIEGVLVDLLNRGIYTAEKSRIQIEANFGAVLKVLEE